MRANPPLQDLPFDQYARYKACTDVIKNLAPKRATVLDCGSGSDCLLERFLPGFSLTSVDPTLVSAVHPGRERISGDAFHPALDGRMFDFVTCIDTFEHIASTRREIFLQRLSGLARLGLVLACPCSDAGDAVETDRYVNEVYQYAFGKPQPWLAQHASIGLPRLVDIEGQLTAGRWQLFKGQNGYAPWRRKLLPFVLSAMVSPAMHRAVTEVSRTFNRELYPFDHQPQGYRQIVLAVSEALAVSDPLPVAEPTMPSEALRIWERVDGLILKHSVRAIRQTRGLLLECGSFLQERLSVFGRTAPRNV